MTKKRKPNKRRLPRPLRRPPNQDEAMDIAMTVYRFAEMVDESEAGGDTA